MPQNPYETLSGGLMQQMVPVENTMPDTTRNIQPYGFDYESHLWQAISDYARQIYDQNIAPWQNPRNKDADPEMILSSIDPMHMGAFQKWFGKSKVVDESGSPITLYLGINKDHPSISHRQDPRSKWGSATYASDSPDLASAYTWAGSERSYGFGKTHPDVIEKVNAKHNAIMELDRSRMSPDEFREVWLPRIRSERHTDALRESGALQHEGQVYPLHAKLENPLDLRDTSGVTVSLEDVIGGINRSGSFEGKAKDAAIARARQLFKEPLGGEKLEQAIEWLAKDFNNVELTGIRKQNLVKSMGFDGVISHFYDKKILPADTTRLFPSEVRVPIGDEYAVFDPTQIKSIWNRGTFDPKDPNILHSLIPIAGMAAGQERER